MFSKSDMTGNEPKSSFSQTLTSTQLYATVVLTIVSLIGVFWGVGVVAANWMTSTAQINFDRRIKSEITPPEGVIYRAIESHMDHRLKGTDDRLLRIELMLDRMYTESTGLEPPPRVGK